MIRSGAIRTYTTPTGYRPGGTTLPYANATARGPPVDVEVQVRRAAARAIGRKNWLFVGSDDHAQSTANLLSMIASAKLHDLDPEQYLRDIFRVLPHWPNDRYLELAPKYWLATRARLDAEQLDAEVGPLAIPPAAPLDQPDAG